MHLESLLENEQIIENFGVSKRVLFLKIFFGLAILSVGLFLGFYFRGEISEILGILSDLVFGIVLAIPIGFGAYLVLQGILFYLSHKFILTNKRIIEVQGFISKRTISSNFAAVTDIVVRQDPIERFLLNTGTILVNTAGSPQAEVVLLGVENPYLYKQKIRDLADKVHALSSNKAKDFRNETKEIL